ncbi:hypothetical protein CFE70_004537 [Pyrenophora teres f. teres 0-1]|uniref:Uncharacterized protein n=2 Tax=Pyrenophora teres f. teres TaxID=97479 RepID=E3S7V0_PYRTT|nr:hypothetical protein PTT_18949 [Pyrenophora teres f. teres 0-1]KAE8833485.1 hypothetical protein HRS9139_05304 [Pyrenophora teres f. teres]KAE8864242.1 hypothetical protein PTNB29_04206 [Pyrenophora teres f. teres]KAE8867033.1 hypothetical protein PTNB73_05127 [Pyrenophora teres f. teres]CAE7032070.1 hypothetical protein PTTW11_04917 [Pyrenophora teres f. teres]
MPTVKRDLLEYTWRCCRPGCGTRIQMTCEDPGKQDIFPGFICCLKCNHTLCQMCMFMSVKEYKRGAKVKKEEEDDDDESWKVKKEYDDVKVKVEVKQEK